MASNATHISTTKAYHDSKEYETEVNTTGSREAHSGETSSTPSIAARKPQTDDKIYLSGVKLVITMGSLVLVAFLMLLDTSIVSTAIPRITSEFHSLDDVGWYGTAYILANCALQPLTGKIYTLFNNKWSFLSFFAVFELGSALCGAAQSSKMLIIGRAVAGMGASGLLNGAFTIVHAAAAPSKAPGLIGICMAMSQLGILCGPLVGGALTQHVSWRWCFYINLPCGAIVGIALLFVHLPDHSEKVTQQYTIASLLEKLDLIGFTLFAGSAIMVLMALNWGGTTYAWSNSTIIGLFCGFVATLIAFILWEIYKGKDAMIPIHMIKRRVVWTSCVNYGCFAGSMLTVTYYLPIYFQAVRGADPTMSGVDLLPAILSTMLFAGLTGGLVGRLGYYLPFGIASGVFLALGNGLLVMLKPNTPTGHWIGFQILHGIGRGLGIQIPLLAVQSNCAKDELSLLTAIVVFSQNFGGAVFLSLAQVVFSSGLRHNLVARASNVDIQAIIAAGATNVRRVAPPEALSEVLLSYSNAVDQTMYLAMGAACGALLFASSMGWVNIKKKDSNQATMGGEEGDVVEEERTAAAGKI